LSPRDAVRPGVPSATCEPFATVPLMTTLSFSHPITCTVPTDANSRTETSDVVA
jgi:hypothetical protein